MWRPAWSACVWSAGAERAGWAEGLDLVLRSQDGWGGQWDQPGVRGGSVSLCWVGSRASRAVSLPVSLSQGSSHPSLPRGCRLFRGLLYCPLSVGGPSSTCVPSGLPTCTTGGRLGSGQHSWGEGPAVVPPTPCSRGFLGSPREAQGSAGPAQSGAVAVQGSPRGPLTAPCKHWAEGPGGLQRLGRWCGVVMGVG